MGLHADAGDSEVVEPALDLGIGAFMGLLVPWGAVGVVVDLGGGAGGREAREGQEGEGRELGSGHGAAPSGVSGGTTTGPEFVNLGGIAQGGSGPSQEVGE